MALLSDTSQSAAQRGDRPIRRTVALLLALLCASGAQGQTQASEVDLKSAFLYKFIHYAEWPQGALGALADPIAICVVEQETLAQVLEGAVQGRTAHDRTVVVRRVAAGDVAGCQVLFVGAPEAGRAEQVVAQVSAKPVLTVGDAEGFARRGGMINFTRRGARLGFEINRSAVRRAGIDLSSQLLKLAELVPDESGGE